MKQSSVKQNKSGQDNAAKTSQSAGPGAIAIPSPNRTGLPDNLKSGIEELSGLSMDDVRVHYNSPKPAQLQALAYTQGTDIHVAPGQERHLPHEAWHVVQQAQGRVKPTMQMKSSVDINDDKGLECEADFMGDQTVDGRKTHYSKYDHVTTLVPHTRASMTGKVIQAVWENTYLTTQFWRWDKLIDGVRWYRHKRLDFDLYYYIVEQPTATNQKMISNQGIELRPGDFQPELDEPPISEEFRQVDIDGAQAAKKNAIASKSYADFVFHPVEHRTEQNGIPTSEHKEITAFYIGSNQKQFENSQGTAGKPKLTPGQTNPGLKSDFNIGKFVFHLTTLLNLYVNPKSGRARTGIAFQGLDPQVGGGSGGACETCKILNDQSMLSESEKHSKGVVAITTAKSNLKMYANQRHDFTMKEFGTGLYSEEDLTAREPIVLRFKLNKQHIEAMEIDPQHPKDECVQLIRGVPIPFTEIEALTSDGWVALQSLQNTLSELMPTAELMPAKYDWYREHREIMMGYGLIGPNESIRPANDHSSEYIS